MRVYRALVIIAGVALLLGMVLPVDRKHEADPSAQRFLAHVSTDKPIYRAGERVFIRTVILDANRHTPLPSGEVSVATWQITGPKGETLGVGNARIQDSVAGYAWDVPADAAGGQYKVTAQFPYHGFPPAERKFEVRAYRTPRLKGEIIFLRDGFGPGDLLKASLHVERAEGGVPTGAAVNISAVVDGGSVFHGTTVVDASGNCNVQFKLPERMTTGDGTLSLAVSDGGVVEPIAKTIPILLNTVDVSFFPEGGDLIAWLPNRVYIEARTPARKPADIQGQIVDSSGHAIVDVRTDHEGRGRFTFTPRQEAAYFLKVSRPAGIDKPLPLPAIRPDGVVLTASGEVTEGNQPVNMQCASLVGGTYTLTLSKHEVLLSSQRFELEPAQRASITLSVPTWADGVLVATLCDASGKARAERLVFRQPSHALHMTVTPDKQSYVPGGQVSLTVTTTDEQGTPVAAVVGLSVTDSSVLQIPEQRDRAPRLNEMVLLEDDVRELADAQVYLDPSDPKSARAVDLLLGTQGWRRFATQVEARFLSRYGDAGRRALADRQQPRPMFATRFGGGGFGGGGFGGRGGFVANDQLALVEAPVAQAQFAFREAANIPVAEVPLADEKALGILMPAASQRMRLGGLSEFRMYAHDLLPNYKPGQRQDFTETLYWAAGLATSADTGTATVSFKLNDAVTSFKVTADAFDSNGRLGEGTATVRAIQPFYIEPKLPLEVSAGDVIRLPIAAVNGTSSDLPVQLKIDTDESLSIGAIDPLTLLAGARDRRVSQIQVGPLPALAHVRVNATAGPYSDQVTRKLVVTPLGFPTEISHSGILEPNSRIIHAVEIPGSVVRGSLIASAALYPTPIGNLADALKRLMQEPYGCFEQTSSTTYPLVMADQYFQSHSGVEPQLIAQSNSLLDKGYQRLVGFQCRTKGYEWFGEDPGHECLSAYALMEFTDMSAVKSVDQTMLGDTRKWLLAHRDGKGGFTHERRALHTWIVDPDCANGYCTWALLESGQKDMDKEIGWLKNAAASDNNSYVKALAANALFLAGDHAGAKIFMEELAGKQQHDGHVSGATTSVVGSEGQSLEIETTSLAALAWLREPAYTANVVTAVAFLAASCQGGRYGSTQSTVLALRAIVEYDRARAHPTAAGTVQLVLNGQVIAEPCGFNADSRGAIKLPDISDRLTPGKHEIELRMSDGSSLPYALDVCYNSITPASADACKLAITTRLKDERLAEGNVSEVKVTVTNRTDTAVPTPAAIIGLPGGLEVRHDQLKELVKAQRIAAYEVRGREVILYWRELAPNQQVDIPLSVTAAVPGTYTGPASRAYLYYVDENKQWVDGLKVTIVPG